MGKAADIAQGHQNALSASCPTLFHRVSVSVILVLAL